MEELVKGIVAYLEEKGIIKKDEVTSPARKPMQFVAMVADESSDVECVLTASTQEALTEGLTNLTDGTEVDVYQFVGTMKV